MTRIQLLVRIMQALLLYSLLVDYLSLWGAVRTDRPWTRLRSKAKHTPKLAHLTNLGQSGPGPIARFLRSTGRGAPPILEAGSKNHMRTPMSGLDQPNSGEGRPSPFTKFHSYTGRLAPLTLKARFMHQLNKPLSDSDSRNSGQTGLESGKSGLLPESPDTKSYNSSATENGDDGTCMLQVMFWDYPYRPSMKQGLYHCPETYCSVQYTLGYSYGAMQKSHVIVLHDLGNWDYQLIKRIRRPDQLLIFLTWESPVHLNKPCDLRAFDWTMTYSEKSDFPIPYGRVEAKSPEDSLQARRAENKRNWASGKKGLAIWIAGNCADTSWPRTFYVRQLSRYLKIDTFGGCGDFPCGDERQGEHCLSKIFSYKFYLAFENSNCEGYITEKMWKNALKHDAVPIVYGAPKSDYERLAPRNSFIHISDFEDMTSLAKYIHLLDKNDFLYNRYFEWRRDYDVIANEMDTVINPTTLCSISKRTANLTKSNEKYTTGHKDWFLRSCSNSVPRPGPT